MRKITATKASLILWLSVGIFAFYIANSALGTGIVGVGTPRWINLAFILGGLLLVIIGINLVKSRFWRDLARLFSPILFAAVAAIIAVNGFGVGFDKDSISTLINATAQLLAFLGVIMAVLYPVQRSLMRDMRAEISRLQELRRTWESKSQQERQDALATIHTNYHGSMSDKLLESAIRELEIKASRSQEWYTFSTSGFVTSFLLIALALAVEIIHMGAMATVNHYDMSSTFSGVEFFMLMSGVFLMVAVVYRIALQAALAF